jgi:hypothetical protein
MGPVNGIILYKGDCANPIIIKKLLARKIKNLG